MILKLRLLVLSMASLALLGASEAAAQWGHVSVSSGVHVSPSPVTLNTDFSVSFTLREVNGDWRNFEQIAIAILRADDSHVFDLAVWNNVTIGANQSWSQTRTGQIWYNGGANPPGTYKAAVRGKLAGGAWFNFSVLTGAANPRSFSVVAPTGYVSISSGLGVSPEPVTLDTDFALTFSLRETTGWAITFQDVKVDILRSDNSTLFTFASYSNVTFSAGQTRSWSPTGQIWYDGGNNPPGTYKAVVRGRVSGGAWFDFTVLAGAANPRSFSVVAPTGYVSVAAGVAVSPQPAVLDQDFAVSFNLREWQGWPIAFADIAVDVRRADNSFLFTLATWNDVQHVSFSAGEFKSFNATGQVWYDGGNNPPGTYKVVVRGRVSGGGWFDFSTIDFGINPKSFPVTQASDLTGYVSVCEGIAVPSSVMLGEDFTASFAMREIDGRPISFAQVKVIVRRNGATVTELAAYQAVGFTAGQRRSWSATGRIAHAGGLNPPGSYQAVVRGTVDGINWFDFTTVDGAVNPRTFTTRLPDMGGLHAYFEEAGARYEIPSNLLKAIGHVESRWDQSAHAGDDWGVMGLNQASLLGIAQRLKSEYAADYGHLSDNAMVELLCAATPAGAQANIRGAASKLRYDADHVSGLIYAHEPRAALETWWFVLTHYNGAGSDARLETSNYPFRVYNCFLNGVADDGGRVPQIPITLPPHIYYRKASTAEVQNLEATGADALLTPVTPAGYIRVVPPFDACAELGNLHDNHGSVLDLPACQPQPFRMIFPISGYTAENAPLNAVYDYTTAGLTHDYTHDNVIVDYVGETGRREYGVSPSNDGYQQDLQGTPFIVNGEYQGIDMPRYLFYDGHPGYDYRTRTMSGGVNSPLLATASGVFHWVGGTYGTAYIDHQNGYRTYYLHCSSYEAQHNGQFVTAGTVVARAGDTGPVGMGAHLHLDIRKVVNGATWYVDPYGWQANEPRAWTRAVNSYLWTGDSPRNLRTAGMSGGDVGLTWDAPQNGQTVSRYHVYRQEGDAGEVEFVADVVGYFTSHRDESVELDTEYTYQVTAVIEAEESEPSNRSSAVVSAFTGLGDLTDLAAQPRAFLLHGNYPNPFNPRTTIRYDLAREDHVSLEVFDARGRRVRALVRGMQAAGEHAAVWDGRDERGRASSSGIYFYRLRAGGKEATGCCVLLK